MKKVLLFILLAFASLVVHAQCNEYYVLNEGTEWVYETYSTKNKLTGKTQQSVKSFDKTPTGFTAIVTSVLFNEKGKEQTRGDIEMVCSNGTFLIDMRRFISEEQQKMFASYKMAVQSENLELPSNLSVGQTLKDGSITLTAEGSPLPMKMSVTVYDRKVEGKETITTPAGIFECFKIASKSKVNTQMGITMNLNFSSTEWFALKVGMVKSESFDKNGKSSGYTQLAAYK
ncbi:MAG: hypothetical protein KF763_06000 [Cyclobacteriaceae bacterium]|nr:hypothetical protein [Cyclobacteriaceae bacterium]